MFHNARSRSCSRALAHRTCPQIRLSHQRRVPLAPSSANEVADAIAAICSSVVLEREVLVAFISNLDNAFTLLNGHRLIADRIVATDSGLEIPSLTNDRLAVDVDELPEALDSFLTEYSDLAMDQALAFVRQPKPEAPKPEAPQVVERPFESRQAYEARYEAAMDARYEADLTKA